VRRRQFSIFCTFRAIKQECALKVNSFLSFLRGTSRADLCPQRDTDSPFCGRWIFLHLPEIQWRRRSPLFMATERCCRTAPSCLVLCLLSLSPYHSRRLLSPFSLHIPYLPFSRVLWQDSTATDNIYHKTRSCHACHACVFLQRTKRKKKFPWQKYAG